MNKDQRLRKLIPIARKGWELYQNFRYPECLPKKSFPIVFFGDAERYFASDERIITVGHNPSQNEIGKSSLGDISSSKPSSDSSYLSYLQNLASYFEGEYYHLYFDPYEVILNGLNASYTTEKKRIAIHTDLCSPIMTNVNYGNLPHNVRSYLKEIGFGFWRELVETLEPTVIVSSLSSNEFLLELSARRLVVGVDKARIVTSKRPIGKSSFTTVVAGEIIRKQFSNLGSKDYEIIRSTVQKYLKSVIRKEG
ncbi:MAG: hypothetical protein M1587_06765 [Thaumarchaeota archaeon]|nr:hypothetical protein [Nitrososphaerota archaeon]